MLVLAGLSYLATGTARRNGRAQPVIRGLAAGAALLIALMPAVVIAIVFVGTATASGLFSRTQVLQLEIALTGSFALIAVCGTAGYRSR